MPDFSAPGYGEGFYSLSDRSAAAGAAAILPLLGAVLRIRSVADFGCSTGAWLAGWREAGVADLQGVDGPWVTSFRLEPSVFRVADLASPLDLGRTFDLAQSLEVAEHLPPQAAATLVATLARHAPLVLFSAAPPGQGGENHINEQPYDYWRALFAAHGFRLYDFVRPQVRHTRIAPWYRFNTLLYARGPVPPAVERTEIPAAAPVPDLAPLSYRLRKQIVRRIPLGAQARLARLLYRFV